MLACYGRFLFLFLFALPETSQEYLEEAPTHRSNNSFQQASHQDNSENWTSCLLTPNLSTLNLSNSSLSKVNLSSLNLSEVSLSSLNLSEVNLSSLNLSEVNLSSLNLSNLSCDTELLVHSIVSQFWLVHDSALVCRFPEEHEAALECVLAASRRCVLFTGVGPPFPDPARSAQGLRYVCTIHAARRYNLNLTCAQPLFSGVLQCIRDEVTLLSHTAPEDPGNPGMDCRSYDIAALCAWEQLQSCGTVTAAVFARMTSSFIRPPSCMTSRAVMAACSWLLSALFSPLCVLVLASSFSMNCAVAN